jgi:hypothetical protein
MNLPVTQYRDLFGVYLIHHIGLRPAIGPMCLLFCWITCRSRRDGEASCALFTH